MKKAIELRLLKKWETVNNYGISLIVLVITIIVIIILAGAVIISLTSSNLISEAKKATFMMNTDTLQSELSLKVLMDMTNSGNTDYNSINGVPSSILGTEYSDFDNKYIIKEGKLYVTKMVTSEEYEQAKSMGIGMYVDINNILLNADFSQLKADGISPMYWNMEYYTSDLTSWLQGDRMYAQGIGGYILSNVFTQYYGNRNFLKDEIYYFRVNECFTSWDTNTQYLYYGMMFGLDTNKSPSAIQKIPNNSEVVVSFRYTITQDYINQGWGFKPAPRVSHVPLNMQNIQQYITKPLFINLTDTFGKGNEPSETWCNNNIPFFLTTTNLVY